MRALGPDLFYRNLIDKRLIIPTTAQGAFGRTAAFEEVISKLDSYIVRCSNDLGLESLVFPPVITRSAIERTGYMSSFPHLCGAVYSFTGDEREAHEIGSRIELGQSWAEALRMTDVVLAPAVCYPFYPTCSGVLPPGGRHVTMVGWVYRHEPSPEPTRLRSFRMREFVRVGTPEAVVDWRDAWMERGVGILRSLGLPVRTDVAADPFFGRTGRVLADGQIQQRLKFEVLVPIMSEENPTACCSFNYHQEKFGSAFGIFLEDGFANAHSACVGFGLERVAMALFSVHGFESECWPTPVRERLWS
jgi:seryl-tRNA synthetase